MHSSLRELDATCDETAPSYSLPHGLAQGYLCANASYSSLIAFVNPYQR